MKQIGPLFLLLLFCMIPSGLLLAQRPFVTSCVPNNQVQNLPCNGTFVKANLSFPSEGKILDPITFHETSVRLYPKGRPKRLVETRRSFNAENQYITLVPTEALQPFTRYVFEVTEDLVDERGFAFLPFSLEFETGSCDQKPLITSRGEEEQEIPEEKEVEVPELLGFQHQWQGDSLWISWQTGRYWPLGELVLEYAQPDQAFEEQESFAVVGDLWKKQQFKWVEERPNWGWNYYRLSFYADDNSSFSTDTLKIFRPRARFSATQIPRDQDLEVEFLLENPSTMAFILKTRSGEIIRRKAGMLEAGEQRMRISLRGLSPGSYLAIMRTRELTLAEVIQILGE